MDITKYSETQFKKTTPQPDIEVIETLDELLKQKSDIEQSLANTETARVYHQSQLEEIDAEIAIVKGLGVKTEAEVIPLPITDEVIK